MFFHKNFIKNIKNKYILKQTNIKTTVCMYLYYMKISKSILNIYSLNLTKYQQNKINIFIKYFQKFYLFKFGQRNWLYLPMFSNIISNFLEINNIIEQI